MISKYKTCVGKNNGLYSLDNFSEHGINDNSFFKEETLELEGFKLKVFTGELWT